MPKGIKPGEEFGFLGIISFWKEVKVKSGMEWKVLFQKFLPNNSFLGNNL